ncbi:MAG: hypothetical protein A3H27_16460 [Acidobacteria bacterium RIFCSPLOWO2_02_FULL_59_13]|nr:MAG: hypothetical protein A3H27_16460 [Acidobacteria bacterium RIFCSPLOWO2_02_FULL_59_13]
MRWGRLEDIWQGVEAAEEAGLRNDIIGEFFSNLLNRAEQGLLKLRLQPLRANDAPQGLKPFSLASLSA